jgi:hypothetical protein
LVRGSRMKFSIKLALALDHFFFCEVKRTTTTMTRGERDKSRTRALYTTRGNLIDEHQDTCTYFGEAKYMPPRRPRRCLAGCWILRLLASAVLAASCAPFAMAFHAVRQCLPLAARTKYTYMKVISSSLHTLKIQVTHSHSTTVPWPDALTAASMQS